MNTTMEHTGFATCDSACPARAVVFVAKANELLALCKHDFEKNEAALSEQGFEVIEDHRDDL